MCTVNILRLPSTPGLHLAVGVCHVYAGVEGYRVVAGAAAVFAPTQRAAKLTVQSTLMAKATPAPKANNIMLPASAASAANTFR
jgi:hypothetical protein